MNVRNITVITPTTGKDSLNRLIESLSHQTVNYVHILLWDDKREGDYVYPDSVSLKIKSPYDLNCRGDNITYSVVVPGSMINGSAVGSSLRSVGLMLANTPYITFADDDVFFEKDHLESMLDIVAGKEWAYCRRKVWKNFKNEVQYIGIDNFESVGDSTSRKVPYEMVDNNCMIFSRRFGSSGAVLYRETMEYNDDRLFYAFLKKNAGIPGKTNKATVNQICPKKLENMFESLCSKE